MRARNLNTPMFWRTLSCFLIAMAVTSAAASAADVDTHAHEHAAMNTKRSRPANAPFGREGDARKVNRVIRIAMSDAMRYFPDQIRVKRGDTVRFIVRNTGKMPHEMVLGTMDGLKKHAELMKQNGAMEHDEANVAHVGPGGTGRIVWQFTKPGEFYFACLIPGHFDAGMIGTVVVR
jgi:uncharacterized cupredoxin-like copper-binding protein